jgi:Cu/Zn superoxide dismutase
LEAKFWFRDGLTDLLPTAQGPFDSAKARITIAEKTSGKTTLRIRIRGIDPSIAGRTLGSHLHTGTCLAGSGTSAGPHYNHDVIAHHKTFPLVGQDPGPDTAEVSPNTEVWFDLVPDEDGVAVDQTTVPFEPIDPDGAMSVVVHELPTDKDGSTATGIGSAGARQACFPLSVSGIFPTSSTE